MMNQSFNFLQSRLVPATLSRSLSTRSQFYNQIRRKFSVTPNTPNQQPRNFQFKENPIIFNRINENMVIKGKEKIVGFWLLTLSASVFAIVLLGGYTRLSRSGLSMVKWHPHRVKLPANQQEWEEEFEEYKKFPEYYLINKHNGMDVEGFKRIYYVEWGHRVVARSIGIIFMGPFVYFLARGYLQPRLKKTLYGLLAFGALQGFFGWWMVKSGLVDKNQTKELDKTPTVSPYRLMIHGYSAYIIYGVGMWLAFNCLRRPQESIINIKNMADHAAMRKIVLKTSHGLLPIILFYGFLTSGTMARYAVNNYPFVGENWFLTRNHFIKDIPLWQNFTENKIVVQVIHRTLATIFALLALRGGVEIFRLQNLSPVAKRSYLFVLGAIALQVAIGIGAIWYPSEIWIPNIHQAGALTVLTALVYSAHCCRKVDPRHIRNLLGKLKVEDPKAYEQMMRGLSQKQLSKSEVEAMKKYYKGEQ